MDSQTAKTLVQQSSSFSLLAYDKGQLPPGNWQPIDDSRIAKVDASSGYQARIYVSTDPANKQIFFANTGTNDLRMRRKGTAPFYAFFYAFSIILWGQLLLGAVLLTHSAAYAQIQEQPPVEQRRYEDWFTFKYSKSYVQDPWVWGYTKEFAERFRMPEKWVEPELKGVLAVAFRVTNVGRMTCGLGGKEDNCWPPLECQLDVYYDSRIKLPWTREEIKRDFLMMGITSYEYTTGEQGYGPLRKRYPQPGAYVIPGTGVATSLIINDRHGGGPTSVIYYDKEIASGVGQIGYLGSVCPDLVGVGKLTFRSAETNIKFMKGDISYKNDSPVHVMEFPVSFMRRANAAYVRDNKPNKEVTDRLMRQFIDSKK